MEIKALDNVVSYNIRQSQSYLLSSSLTLIHIISKINIQSAKKIHISSPFRFTTKSFFSLSSAFQWPCRNQLNPCRENLWALDYSLHVLR